MPPFDADSTYAGPLTGGSRLPPDFRPRPRARGELERTFTPTEVHLVERMQAFAESGRAGPFRDDLWRALETGITGLGNIAEAIRSYPSLREKRVLGGKERSRQTLIDEFVRGGEHAFEWNLPTKAVLSRAFGIAKVNFLTSLRYVIEACQAEEVPSLLEAVAAGVEEAVYTRLAEEVLGTLINSTASDAELKRLAAHRLVELWEGRLALTMDTLAPILRSAWTARTRAVRVFGTLLGTAEILQMLFADCESCFVEFFSRREVTPEEQQAFEEFLFDIPYESLQRVRYRMLEDRLSVVDRTKVESYLGLPPGALRPTVGDPKELYVSFRHRRVRAQYRVATGAPGPRRTAEGYLMEAILRHQLPDASTDPSADPSVDPSIDPSVPV
jgi:hypothetical protein